MAVPPCNGVADAAEDDAVGDELVDLVQIEAVVSCCPQAFETVCQCIGNGLPATLVEKAVANTEMKIFKIQNGTPFSI